MHITIPLAPISKKNHSQIIWNKATKKPMIIPSEQYKKYEKACAEFIPQMPFNMFDCPVNVCCIFYMPTRRKVDLSNLLNAVLDLLVHYGVLLDDNRNIVYSVDGSRVYYDKNNARTEIEITEIEDAEIWAKR